MINLAGDSKCDVKIKEELYLAGIESIPVSGNGEVPYSFEGRIRNWKLQRAWTYWIVNVEIETDGLPLKDALKLHNTPNPVDGERWVGLTIRCGGHAGAPSPDEFGARPIHDEQLNERLKKLGYKEEYNKSLKLNYIPITVGEITKLCNEGKLNVERYVTSYHIDDQIGLNEFAKFLKQWYKDNENER